MYRNILKWSGMGLFLWGLTGCVSAPFVLIGAAGAGTANVGGSPVPLPQQAHDVAIKSDVISYINQNPTFQHANIEVTVFNGIVLLLGQVPTGTLKASIAKQASQVPNVVIVYNQITVGPNASFSDFANDGWITSKVKTSLVGDANLLHFKVVTQDGVVYLLGQVTEAEGNAAASIASKTPGVKHVVKIFNYIAAPNTATPTEVRRSGLSEAMPVQKSGELNDEPSLLPQKASSVPGPEASLGDRSHPGPSASD